MKRTSLMGLALLLLIVLALTACNPSPKELANDFVKYLPAEIGEWERVDKDTAKLLNNTVSSVGHIIMIYEGPDGARAYINVIAHPSEDAANVAAKDLEREWLLQGLVIDVDRATGQARALVAQTDRVRYALFQEVDVTVEINAIAADADNPVPDEAFGLLLDAVRVAYAKVIDE